MLLRQHVVSILCKGKCHKGHSFMQDFNSPAIILSVVECRSCFVSQ
jgi:hypothetical protein